MKKFSYRDLCRKHRGESMPYDVNRTMVEKILIKINPIVREVEREIRESSTGQFGEFVLKKNGVPKARIIFQRGIIKQVYMLRETDDFSLSVSITNPDVSFGKGKGNEKEIQKT